jgi:hypothetical protein
MQLWRSVEAIAAECIVELVPVGGGSIGQSALAPGFTRVRTGRPYCRRVLSNALSSSASFSLSRFATPEQFGAAPWLTALSWWAKIHLAKPDT